jgi:DNA mismatch endonuclease, patch repair protein
MGDPFTAQARSECMARIRDRNTKPEIIVRSMLYRMGFRFRIHVAHLPGRPDIVLPKLKKIIFVHGCFWHMHSCRRGRSDPKTNAAFWRSKRETNAARDMTQISQLRRAGWSVRVLWECQLRSEAILSRRLGLFLSNSKVGPTG